jgi:phage tail sheath protein FI
MGMPVAERLTTGIQVAEQSGSEQAIARSPTAVTAFVGRALRGPVNRPVSISSFADYQAIFGGLWQPSTLGYAVEQFFENGGRQALVVRVINGARPPTLDLPAANETLRLEALGCGTREFLRASVDYDGIGDNEEDSFNLVIQRVRAAGSEHVEDQEIFRRLSIRADAARFVAAALAESSLARVIGEVPLARPDRTLRHDGRGTIGYVHSNPDGDDGAALSDYDVIGSAAQSTGLFALKAAEQFNFLCIPPLTREVDVGMSVLLVAALFCRERNAMLVVDPPAGWITAELALRGARDWQFHHENALMYFPRLLVHDRLRGRYEQFAPCGAIAGMLARNDELYPLWSASEGEDALLRPGYRPLCVVSDAERTRLANAGINTIQAVRTSARLNLSARTLAGNSSGSSDWKYLAARRLALFIVTSIERGTRWVVFETNGPELWRHVQHQVESFLESLDAAGAFLGRAHDEAYFVVCDDRINTQSEVRTGVLNILIGFAAMRAGEYHAYVISHDPAGSRARTVSVNRLELGGRRLVEEMEGAEEAFTSPSSPTHTLRSPLARLQRPGRR